MTPREREFVARLCAARAGLKVDPDKPYLLDSRLGPVARREGFGSVSELVQAVRDHGDTAQAWAVVEAMASSDTAFFRDGAVFDRLWGEVVPRIASQRADGVVRIWSAGCGAGQEVYSLAILAEEKPVMGARIELFASDLSERALEKAQSGLYSQFEVQRGLAARQLVRHFEKRDEAFILSRRVRQHVRWRRVNLIEDISRLGQFDVVMCRNVLSGLAEPARRQVLEQLGAAVAPGGALVFGAAERVRAPADLTALDGAPGVFLADDGRRAAA